MQTTAIIDYDAGNIRSVEKAIRYLGKDAVVTADRETILSADRVILPGVGAFGDAMGRLHALGLTEVIRQTVEQKTPFLGICLGLQLVFERSEESPGVPGLGLLKGEILRLPDVFCAFLLSEGRRGVHCHGGRAVRDAGARLRGEG